MGLRKRNATLDKHVIELERDFPRHHEMFEDRKREGRDKPGSSKEVFQLVGIPYNIDVGARQDIHPHIVEMLGDRLPASDGRPSTRPDFEHVASWNLVQGLQKVCPTPVERIALVRVAKGGAGIKRGPVSHDYPKCKIPPKYLIGELQEFIKPASVGSRLDCVGHVRTGNAVTH